jgi:tRNA nucleotidyltransferase (CCA-adding enzyme)
LIDLFGGLEDLRSGIVRPLHQDSFSDDPTRVFRAARYISRLGFRPSSILLWQVKQALENGWAARLSPHRITQEILRVLAEPNPALAMGLLKRWGYLGLAHPVLAKFHGWKGCPKADVPVRLAWLSARLGPKHGAEFLSALAFSRELAAPAREVLDLLARRTSPRTPLSTPARAALKLAYPDLPAQALTPAFISGGDLKALGVLAGPDMGRLLDKQARLQWQGRLKSRSQALSWAEKKL